MSSGGTGGDPFRVRLLRVGAAAATAKIQQQACRGTPGVRKCSDCQGMGRNIACLACSGGAQRLSQPDTDVRLRDKRALPLSSLLYFGKRFAVHPFVNRNLLQLRATGDQVERAVEDLGKPLAIVPQTLHADLRRFAAPARPSLEQVEEPVEQLPVRMAQELIPDIAEFNGIAPERLGGLGGA